MPHTLAPSLQNLRRFARSRTAENDRCALCSAPLPADHRHLVEASTGRLVCSCRACALLFCGRSDARYRRIPERIVPLPAFQMSDAQWENLAIPIDLAFLFHSTPEGRIVAVYPSPAGSTRSQPSLDAWQDLVAANPVLAQLEPDAEALLVNRVACARDYYRAGIDACYRLAGVVRTKWRGFTGGTEVWNEIARCFASLKEPMSSDARPEL